jgi:hypothetical protein
MSFLPLLASLLCAAADGGAPPARSPEAVLADYSKALGGLQGVRKHHNVHIKRDIEAKGMNIHGTEERWSTDRGQALVVTELANLGKFRQGSDGKVQWTEDPINGLRVLSGGEEEEARLETAWDSEVALARQYKEVRSAAAPESPPPGRKWECLELVPRQAGPAVSCFDAETHLRVYQKGTQDTPQGKTPYVRRFSDWRAVDDTKIPYTEEMSAGALSIVSHVTSIGYDEKVPPRLFALPKGIKAGKPAASKSQAPSPAKPTAKPE